MTPIRNILVLVKGQSNQAGATRTPNGGAVEALTSDYMGVTDPLAPNANTGGSCWPLLADLGLQRGVRYTFLNGAVGGAAAAHFTGLVGATVTGSQTDPLTYHNMVSSGLSISAGTPCVEGNAAFDPFGLVASLRTLKQARPQFSECIGLFANAESDSTTSLTQYRDTLVSMANYDFATGCNAVFLGLSSSGANSSGQMDILQNAVAAAIAKLTLAGKRAFWGANLYAKFGMTPPFNTDDSVHLTIEGQKAHARLWDSALQAAGY